MSAPDLAPAEPSPWATYRDRREEGVLAYQRCEECAHAVFPPRVLCPSCGSVRLHWADSAGRGEVYSQTLVTGRQGGYHVLLVDLDEGFRVMGSAADDADELPIGTRVVGRFEPAGGDDSVEPRLNFAKEVG